MQQAVPEPSASTLTLRAPSATLKAFNSTIHQLIDGHSQVLLDIHLIQIAHNIAGNGKTFGFASAGEVAREIELCLEPACATGRLPDAAEQERVAVLLASLKNAAQ